MPRFGVVWVVSVLLQSLGVIWIIGGVFWASVVRLDQAIPDPSFAGADLTNATTFTLVLMIIFFVLIGLMSIAAGQALVVLMAIEQNSRRRPAYRSPGSDPSDLPGPQSARPMSDNERRALIQRRRYQNPKDGS